MYMFSLWSTNISLSSQERDVHNQTRKASLTFNREFYSNLPISSLKKNQPYHYLPRTQWNTSLWDK